MSKERDGCRPVRPRNRPAAVAASSCVGFVGNLTRLAESAGRLPVSTEAARRRLAADLVYGFVPRTTLLGVRVRRWIAGPDPVEGRTVQSVDRWGPDGFRPSLVRGGQDEEVVRHVAAAAACVLAGRVYLVRIASLYDWIQGFFRGRAEAKAEMAGNEAGLRVGRVLVEYLAGRLDAARLPTVLGAILCK